MGRKEIRITGFGGQGVVLSGFIIGKACAVNAGRHASMMQSFGPEARGSACSSTVVVSDEEVLYPYIERPDVLVAMSVDGYATHRRELAPDGTLIFEADLVHPQVDKGQRAFGIPATRIAESLGRAIVQNIVMLGFFTAATDVVLREHMREAVRSSVPAGTEDLNLRAFDAGYEYFEEHYGEGAGRRADAAADPAAAEGVAGA